MVVCSLANKPMVRYLMVVLMVMVTMIVEPMAGKVSISSQRDLEIELRLKQLNKQALTSIESSNGEIIDCIPIEKQPAFDHPMLKNHTIQMTPSSYPHEVLTEEYNAPAPTSNDEEQPENISQPWQMAGECPENTIPIKRITKDDLLRVDDIKNYGKKSNISQPHQFYHPTDIAVDNNNHEYAITYVKGGPFRGTKAQIHVWKPRTEAGESSISQIWIFGGKTGSGLMNTIEAGTHVDTALYGDANPHFFIYWTSDGYHNTGCYNLLCSGFVQINRRVSPGGAFNHISTYNGPQYIFTLQIWKDPKTENWWLLLNERDLVGYWPKVLFPNLAHGTSMIEWGGEVVSKKNRRQHTITEMGSGHFPSEGFKKASNFKAVKAIDMNNGIINPVGVQTLVSRPTCYNLHTGYGRNRNLFFYYGGPGRNPRCP